MTVSFFRLELFFATIDFHYFPYNHVALLSVVIFDRPKETRFWTWAWAEAGAGAGGEAEA